MALVFPIRLSYDFFLCRDELVHWAHPIPLLWAPFDASQRGDTIVDDDTDLWSWDGCTFQDCYKHRISSRERSMEGDAYFGIGC